MSKKIDTLPIKMTYGKYKALLDENAVLKGRVEKLGATLERVRRVRKKFDHSLVSELDTRYWDGLTWAGDLIDAAIKGKGEG